MRLWIEKIGPAQHEGCLQVKRVLSGETRYFRERKEVVAFMLAKLAEGEADCWRMVGENQ